MSIPPWTNPAQLSIGEAPLPRTVRLILRKVHRRYMAAPPHLRPAINDPACQPLTCLERIALAQNGFSHLPPDLIRRGCTQAEHLRREILGTDRAAKKFIAKKIRQLVQAEMTSFRRDLEARITEAIIEGFKGMEEGEL